MGSYWYSASNEDIESTFDEVFGNKEDVIKLISEENWEKAASYGDGVAYQAFNNNQQWIWDQVYEIKKETNTSLWNSGSWGGIAMAIYYGQNFPDRLEDVEEYKDIIIYLANKHLYTSY